MRKTLLIARREYLAAVRTKAFVVSLLVLPVMAGGGILLMRLLLQNPDLEERAFAVVDRSPGGVLATVLAEAVQQYHDKDIYDRKTGKQTRPALRLWNVAPTDDVDAQRLELSERVRAGELVGFLDIGPDVYATDLLPPAEPDAPPDPRRERRMVRYQSDRPQADEFYRLALAALAPAIREERAVRGGLPLEQARQLLQTTTFVNKGLSARDTRTGEVRDVSEQNRMAGMAVPAGMCVLMVLGMLMGATPLMQSVVEEKMQRIAEVLLGSVGPFELMLGKLLGTTGVSLTIVSAYLLVACVAAYRFGFAEYLTPGLVIWFLIYQVLAVLLYGSFFIAIGAACTNMKETQNLLWPVMLIATVPMLVLVNLLREPNSTGIVALSFFPLTTPMLMIARQAIPPGIPWWQPVAGVFVVTGTTVLCVWAAGRVFRLGLLLQGRGATPREIVRWVLRG